MNVSNQIMIRLLYTYFNIQDFFTKCIVKNVMFKSLILKKIGCRKKRMYINYMIKIKILINMLKYFIYNYNAGT